MYNLKKNVFICLSSLYLVVLYKRWCDWTGDAEINKKFVPCDQPHLCVVNFHPQFFTRWQIVTRL